MNVLLRRYILTVKNLVKLKSSQAWTCILLTSASETTNIQSIISTQCMFFIKVLKPLKTLNKDAPQFAQTRRHPVKLSTQLQMLLLEHKEL